MSLAVIYRTDYASLRDTDTIGAAIGQMLAHHVSDLPVVDVAGRFLGMFTLQRLLAVLLPKAATIGDGVPDLAFVSDTLDDLRERMRAIEGEPVRTLATPPAHVVRPDTTPMEMVLLLYRGVNAIPVVRDGDGTLVGMVATRDVLAALAVTGGR